MKYVSYLFNALVWAVAVMFATFGTLPVAPLVVVAGTTVVAFVALVLFRLKEPHGIGFPGSLAGVIVAVLVGLAFLGPETLATVPALPLWAVLAVAGLLFEAFYDHADPSDPYAAMDADEAALARTSRIARWATFGVIAVVVAAVSCVPAARDWMALVFAELSSGDIGAVAELIRSFGPWAAVVSFALMVLQSVAAPIPAFLITFANAAVFGWWQGAILSWTSAMAGAALCFFIARFLGRDAVAHFVTKGALKSVDRFFERFGDKSVLVLRLLPFMSFDYVSYAAGLTAMGFWGFFWATGLGQLPATIVYSYVGSMLTGSAQIVMTALLMLFAVFFMIVIAKQAFSKRNEDLMVSDADVAAEAEARLDGDEEVEPVDGSKEA